jgi:hypothetical protein
MNYSFTPNRGIWQLINEIGLGLQLYNLRQYNQDLSFQMALEFHDGKNENKNWHAGGD